MKRDINDNAKNEEDRIEAEEIALLVDFDKDCEDSIKNWIFRLKIGLIYPPTSISSRAMELLIEGNFININEAGTVKNTLLLHKLFMFSAILEDAGVEMNNIILWFLYNLDLEQPDLYLDYSAEFEKYKHDKRMDV